MRTKSKTKRNRNRLKEFSVDVRVTHAETRVVKAHNIREAELRATDQDGEYWQDCYACRVIIDEVRTPKGKVLWQRSP